MRVEGWQALATAHGCIASIELVREEDGNYIAVAQVRRIADGMVLTSAEGFVGTDEPTWADRPVYARRAMAQTRAISRACRAAFSHVVVLIDAGLQTTPAEEIAEAGFVEEIPRGTSQQTARQPARSRSRRVESTPVQDELRAAKGCAWKRWQEMTPDLLRDEQVKALELHLHTEFNRDTGSISTDEWKELSATDFSRLKPQEQPVEPEASSPSDASIPF